LIRNALGALLRVRRPSRTHAAARGERRPGRLASVGGDTAAGAKQSFVRVGDDVSFAQSGGGGTGGSKAGEHQGRMTNVCV